MIYGALAGTSAIVEATVNGRKISRAAKPHLRLLDFLRDDLGHTGTKEGCGAGECGTCSVFVDGVLLKSCLVPVAKAQGTAIETVEGLSRAGELSVLQQAFHKAGASQCGYCIPGMVMAATAALRANPFADREEIKERLGGNICRCTGYQKIFDAVELARDVNNGRRPPSALAEDEPADGAFIGANVRRLDAPSKVSGALKYAGDMVMPHMLHMAVLRSPHAHARIVSIDTSEAETMPGVEGVITCADVPGVDNFGVFVHDQPVMARGKVRYVGEQVAAVASEDPLVARRALSKIKIVYEPLPAVFDAHEAMRPGAPVLHDYAPDNMVKHIPIRVGDIERGFAESDLIVEEVYTTQQVEHAYLEPEAGLAYVDADGVITILSPSQNITHHRHMLSRIIAQPINKVRFIMSPVGGGFGGKEDMVYQGMLALMAMKTRRPVRLVFTREESIITTAKRHPSHTTTKMGLMRDGRIRAVEIKLVSDGGAYGMSTEGVMRKAAILAAGPYAVPNVKVDTYGVYTNNTPSGAFRSFGALQSQFATETHLDICAEKLGLDPFEIRRINAMRDGATTHTKQKLGSVSMLRALDAAEQASRWEAGAPSSRGRHAAILAARACVPLFAGRTLRGSAPKPAARWRDGQDARPWRRCLLVWHCPHGHRRPCRRLGRDRRRRHRQDRHRRHRDRRGHPDRAGADCRTRDRRAAAGRHHRRQRHRPLAGSRTRRRHPPDLHDRQCRGARFAPGARHAGRRDCQALGRRRPHLKTAAGEIWAEGTNHKMPMSEAVHIAKSRGVVPVGSASFGTDTTGLDPVDGSGRPWQAYVFGCQVAEVEVDTLTGEVQVLGIWAVHDVGRAVNPRGVEGQIEGGIVQALGQGLMEDYRTVDGRATTPNLAKYILPTSLDVPQVTSVILEDPDPIGPFGVKGHWRARHDSDYSGRHERHLRCRRGADNFSAGDAGKSA